MSKNPGVRLVSIPPSGMRTSPDAVANLCQSVSAVLPVVSAKVSIPRKTPSLFPIEEVGQLFCVGVNSDSQSQRLKLSLFFSL